MYNERAKEMTKDEIRTLITKHLEYGQVNQLSREDYWKSDRISGTLLTQIEKLIQDILKTNERI